MKSKLFYTLLFICLYCLSFAQTVNVEITIPTLYFEKDTVLPTIKIAASKNNKEVHVIVNTADKRHAPRNILCVINNDGGAYGVIEETSINEYRLNILFTVYDVKVFTKAIRIGYYSYGTRNMYKDNYTILPFEIIYTE